MNPTTPKSEHSPLPWKWEIVSGNPDLSEITDADGEYIADTITETGDGPFIVEACNNCETLKALNERLVRALKSFIDVIDPWQPGSRKTIEEAKAVLKEVGK